MLSIIGRIVLGAFELAQTTTATDPAIEADNYPTFSYPEKLNYT